LNIAGGKKVAGRIKGRHDVKAISRCAFYLYDGEKAVVIKAEIWDE